MKSDEKGRKKEVKKLQSRITLFLSPRDLGRLACTSKIGKKMGYRKSNWQSHVAKIPRESWESSTKHPRDRYQWIANGALCSQARSLVLASVIPLETVAPIRDEILIWFSGEKNGLEILKNKLMSGEEVAALPSNDHISYVVSDHGYALLKNKLISPNDIIRMPNDKLTWFRSDNCYQLLKKGLLTAKELLDMTLDRLDMMANDNSVQALEKELLTKDEILNMPQGKLAWLLCIDGIKAMEACDQFKTLSEEEINLRMIEASRFRQPISLTI